MHSDVSWYHQHLKFWALAGRVLQMGFFILTTKLAVASRIPSPPSHRFNCQGTWHFARSSDLGPHSVTVALFTRGFLLTCNELTSYSHSAPISPNPNTNPNPCSFPSLYEPKSWPDSKCWTRPRRRPPHHHRPRRPTVIPSPTNPPPPPKQKL